MKKMNKNLEQKQREWRQSLEDRLKLGWTERGQTAEIVRSACVKAHIFGDNRRDDATIVQEVIGLPGYEEYCEHQHEIVGYVTDWMDVTSKYWSHWRSKRQQVIVRKEQPPQKEPKAKSTKRRDDILSRLRQIVTVLATQPLPTKNVEIVQMIQSKGKEMFGKKFSINTLYSYRYKAEWYFLVEMAQAQTDEQLNVN
jgi:hypothetical protein